MGGRRITSEQRSSRLAEVGRICCETGCGTRLSVYNDLDFCSLHQPMVVPRMRGRILEN